LEKKDTNKFWRLKLKKKTVTMP